MTFFDNQAGTLPGSESREYPSRLFYMDLLLKEVQKASEAHKSIDELLDQIREIWTAPDRTAVLHQLENHLGGRYDRRFPNDLQVPVADALSDLIRAADDQPRGSRHKADLTVSRIIKYLDPHLQLEVIAPWFRDPRPFRAKTVMRSLARADDLAPVADMLVYYFRTYADTNMLRLVAHTPGAAVQIFPEELNPYFNRYITRYTYGKLPSRSLKYFAMLAARVLVVGGQPIPSRLFQVVPEVFSWAIEHIGDPDLEGMLIWLITEHPDNPEVLWSAIRTSGHHFMNRALGKALDAAHQLLLKEEGVLLLPRKSATPEG